MLRQGRGHPDDKPGYEKQYSVLLLVVGLSPRPLEATLRWLALTLCALCLCIWFVSVAACRWLCRRALEPVSRMATAATAMTAAELGKRLPILGTGDELDALGRAFNDLLDRLQDAFVRLQAAYDGQRRFAGDASHQLRTPLAALLGQVQVALRRDRPAEKYRLILERVQSEAGRLRQIIESLLLLAQPDGARPEPEVLNLEGWLPEHMRHWASHPRAADLRAEVAGTGTAPLNVLAHPPLLAQLLDNLIDNACKYSEPGTPVVVKTWREDGSVMLGVEDRGCGLEAEEISHVFKPFFRAERARSGGYAGVGLGLAVAQHIARAYCGSVEVRNNPEAGCLFMLSLPICEVVSVGRCES
jgi:two-component system OmpR family sensor kinase